MKKVTAEKSSKRRKKDVKSAVRISLLDVMYGVVFAYGFGFFDQANTLTHYILLVFAYVVIVIDWIYVHIPYWGWKKYKNVFLISDILILFIISRLFSTSIQKCNYPNYYYWLWMAFLFLIYFIWDVLAKKKRLPTEYDLRYPMAGDLLTSIAFFTFFILRWQNILEPNTFSKLILVNVIPIDTIPIIIYIIAFLTWLKKLPQIKKRPKDFISRLD